MQLFDAAGTERFQVTEAGQGSGGVKLFDSGGRKRFQVYDGGDWLGTQFLDVTGRERVGVRMGPDGESDLFVTGGATEWLASACSQ